MHVLDIFEHAYHPSPDAEVGGHVGVVCLCRHLFLVLKGNLAAFTLEKWSVYSRKKIWQHSP